MFDHSACCLKELKKIVLHLAERLPFDYRYVIENLRSEVPQKIDQTYHLLNGQFFPDFIDDS